MPSLIGNKPNQVPSNGDLGSMAFREQDQFLALAGTQTVSGAKTFSEIITASKGVAFPATQVASADANTLDDYEEGTWTPTDQSGAGLSFTVYNAAYTKVGRLVEIQASITYPSTANASATQIGGLPFTSANGTDNTGGICIAATNTNISFTGLIGRNDTKFYLEKLDGSAVTNANMSTKYIKFFGWYYV